MSKLLENFNTVKEWFVSNFWDVFLIFLRIDLGILHLKGKWCTECCLVKQRWFLVIGYIIKWLPEASIFSEILSSKFHYVLQKYTPSKQRALHWLQHTQMEMIKIFTSGWVLGIPVSTITSKNIENYVQKIVQAMLNRFPRTWSHGQQWKKDFEASNFLFMFSDEKNLSRCFCNINSTIWKLK